jgi:DNA-binding MarR family transcriptional regulator
MREKQRGVVMLEEPRRRASARPWRGKEGFTDRDVYRTLIEEAQEHGSVCEDGIRVSISVRELSRRARISRRSTLRSLNDRLIPAGLVKRSTGGWGETSGTLILLTNGNSSDSRQHSTVLDNISNPIPKFRWGSGKLGKLSGAVIETLHASGPCTRPEIAKALGRKSRDIKSTLNRLVASGLVERDGDTYSLPANFEGLLEERFLSDGTLETDRKHKELYEKEREAYLRNVIGEEEVRTRTSKERDDDI